MTLEEFKRLYIEPAVKAAIEASDRRFFEKLGVSGDPFRVDSGADPDSQPAGDSDAGVNMPIASTSRSEG